LGHPLSVGWPQTGIEPRHGMATGDTQESMEGKKDAAFGMLHIRLGKRVIQRIDLLAEAHGLNRTAMIAMLLALAIERAETDLERSEERMEKMGISNAPPRSAA